MNTAALIAQAFAEDQPRGDLATDMLKREFPRTRVRLRASEDLVLAGRQVFEDCLRYVDPGLEANWQFRDGELVLQGQSVAWFKGEPKNVLRAEQVALNFLGRFSGIATLTRCYVQAMNAANVRFEPTRASTPGLRALEFRAVESGGGSRGTLDVSEVCAITRGHVDLAGSLEAAVKEIRNAYSGPFEVDCVDVAQARVALELGAARLNLNGVEVGVLGAIREFTPAHIDVGWTGHLELADVAKIANAGVNFIRLTPLITSAPAAEFRMDFIAGDP